MGNFGVARVDDLGLDIRVFLAAESYGCGIGITSVLFTSRINMLYGNFGIYRLHELGLTVIGRKRRGCGLCAIPCPCRFAIGSGRGRIGRGVGRIFGCTHDLRCPAAKRIVVILISGFLSIGMGRHLVISNLGGADHAAVILLPCNDDLTAGLDGDLCCRGGIEVFLLRIADIVGACLQTGELFAFDLLPVFLSSAPLHFSGQAGNGTVVLAVDGLICHRDLRSSLIGVLDGELSGDQVEDVVAVFVVGNVDGSRTGIRVIDIGNGILLGRNLCLTVLQCDGGSLFIAIVGILRLGERDRGGYGFCCDGEGSGHNVFRSQITVALGDGDLIGIGSDINNRFCRNFNFFVVGIEVLDGNFAHTNNFRISDCNRHILCRTVIDEACRLSYSEVGCCGYELLGPLGVEGNIPRHFGIEVERNCKFCIGVPAIEVGVFLCGGFGFGCSFTGCHLLHIDFGAAIHFKCYLMERCPVGIDGCCLRDLHSGFTCDLGAAFFLREPAAEVVTLSLGTGELTILKGFAVGFARDDLCCDLLSTFVIIIQGQADRVAHPLGVEDDFVFTSFFVFNYDFIGNSDYNGKSIAAVILSNLKAGAGAVGFGIPAGEGIALAYEGVLGQGNSSAFAGDHFQCFHLACAFICIEGDLTVIPPAHRLCIDGFGMCSLCGDIRAAGVEVEGKGINLVLITIHSLIGLTGLHGLQRTICIKDLGVELVDCGTGTGPFCTIPTTYFFRMTRHTKLSGEHVIFFAYRLCDAVHDDRASAGSLDNTAEVGVGLHLQRTIHDKVCHHAAAGNSVQRGDLGQSAVDRIVGGFRSATIICFCIIYFGVIY